MNEEQQQPSNLPQLPRGMIKKIVFGLVAAVVILAGLSCFYTVQEHERAAVLTFGKYTKEESAGLKFKLPYPIQQVKIVPAEKRQRITIGYREHNGQVTAVDEEALMITGDENILSADAVVEWKISNIRDYLYNVDDPEMFLRNSSIAAIRSVIGAEKLDFAITEGKTIIQAKAKEKLLEIQQIYKTGIQVIDLKFQDIEPPPGEVQDAFKEVTNAREEKNTKVNVANKYENDRIPKARGEAQAMLENAEATKKSRVLNAEGDVAKFNAVYAEYTKSPAVTQRRLVLETLEKILPNAKIIITDGSGDTVKYLPLDEILNRTKPAQQPSQQQGGGAQ